MMFDFSRNIFLNLVLNGTAQTGPLSYVGLLTDVPSPTGGSSIVEPSGGGYARVNTGINWSTPYNGQSHNSTTITFPKATASWGTIIGLAVFTAPSGDPTVDRKPMFYGKLRTPININSSSPALSLSPGSVIISADGCIGNIIQNAILSAFLIQVIPSFPSTLYLGLSYCLPESDGVGWAEPAVGVFNYDRVSIDNKTALKNPVTAGLGYNITTVSIPAAGSPTGSWGTNPLVAWGLWTSATPGSGDLYFFGKLHSPVVVGAGTPSLSFTPGSIQIGIDLACC